MITKIITSGSNANGSAYTQLFEDASKVLNDKFLIAFEIGETQGQEIIDIAKKGSLFS